MAAEPGADRDERRFPAAFVTGIIVVVAIIACVVLFTRHSASNQTATASAKLPFGPAEQAYASKIDIGDIKMARAMNLLNQEFTYVGGTVTNNGARPVAGLVVVVEFHDPFNQVVLRDTQRLIGARSTPLGPGQHRDFEFALEHVPAQWNQQAPTFRVRGLLLQ